MTEICIHLEAKKQYQGSPAKLEIGETTCVGDEQLAPVTKMSQSKRAAEDKVSKGTFMSSWLFKTKLRETVELRQAPRSGKNIEIYLFQLPPLWKCKETWSIICATSALMTCKKKRFFYFSLKPMGV